VRPTSLSLAFAQRRLTPPSSARADFLHALRWSIGLAVVASGYAVAVRTGYIDDVLGHASSKLTQNFLANR